MWEKAVADDDVRQMFGMNIKQEGIEVQGDQVGLAFSNPAMLSKAKLTILLITGFLRPLDARLASRP